MYRMPFLGYYSHVNCSYLICGVLAECKTQKLTTKCCLCVSLKRLREGCCSSAEKAENPKSSILGNF